MNISTELLEAFLVTYQQGTFTKASQSLGLSQSALSQKISKLEDLLAVTLLLRNPGGLQLTSAGEKLLVYAKQQLDLEKNFLHSFVHDKTEMAGTFRLAGYSSIVRSILIPKLSPWLKKNPHVSVEFSSYEVFDLINVLKSNKADAVVVDYQPHLSGIDEVEIGKEEFVIIENKTEKNIQEVYLDHGPQDNATESYFRHIGKKTSYKRGFMGDVYGIIDGVANGLGKAVMSKHLVDGDKRFKITESKPYFRPMMLCYFKQEYYSPLQKMIIEKLSN